MLDACRRISLYIDGWSLFDFESDTRTIDAVCMNLIRIGEGARMLSSDMKASAVGGGVPWRQIVNMRNFIAHAYAIVESDTVWRTATVSAPELAGLLREMRASLDS